MSDEITYKNISEVKKISGKSLDEVNEHLKSKKWVLLGRLISRNMLEGETWYDSETYILGKLRGEFD